MTVFSRPAIIDYQATSAETILPRPRKGGLEPAGVRIHGGGDDWAIHARITYSNTANLGYLALRARLIERALPFGASRTTMMMPAKGTDCDNRVKHTASVRWRMGIPA